jgi:peptide/nickel transport system permease protein
LLIIVSEILPNGFGPIIVESTLEIGYAIMEESGLSFLGFGIQPRLPAGATCSAMPRSILPNILAGVFPGLMIFFTIISVIILAMDCAMPWTLQGAQENR